MIKNLKGKQFEEALKEFDLKQDASYKEDLFVDMYFNQKDENNWICYTTSFLKVEDDEELIDEELIDLENGYWSECINGNIVTELEI